MRFRLSGVLLLLAALVTPAAVVTAGPASAAPVSRPLLVVLCKFTDSLNEPHQAPYYEELFGPAGAGKKGMFDYWKDVSYDRITLTGTTVKGWYTIPDTKLADWQAKDRAARFEACSSQAKDDVTFGDFAGVVVLTNQTGFQEDLFGAGPPSAIAGTTYPDLGRMLAEEDQTMQYLLHEAGHSLGLTHSRVLSNMTPTSTQSDYGDPYDVMSCESCFDGVTTPQGTGGPGLNAVQLTTAGWMPAERSHRSFDNSTCSQTTVPLAALSRPDVPGFFEVRVPASIPVSFRGMQLTTTDYYSVELRTQSGWDAGIPAATTLIHLHGQDGYSYLVDTQGDPGTYYRPSGIGQGAAGTEYVDTARNAFVAINALDGPGGTATVTVAGCRIQVGLAYTGPTTADYGDRVSLSGEIRVGGTTAPAPYRPITLSLGAQSCTAEADLQGRATCDITIDQPAGAVTAGAAFAGDHAYEAGSTSTAFQITREQTSTSYTGPSVIAAGQPVTLSGRLVEEAGPAPVEGRELTLELGGQSCTGTTDAAGSASCVIASVEPALGPQEAGAGFAGDAYYEPSSDRGRPVTVFAFPSRGSFVLGDRTVASAAGTTPVTWWSDAWSSVNDLSGSGASPAFKGFAAMTGTVPPTCGSTWASTPGNSPPPVGDVPPYMGVVVSSSVSRSGSDITGDVVKIVVVRTDPGYAPSPANTGTGTIVATYCG